MASTQPPSGPPVEVTLPLTQGSVVKIYRRMLSKESADRLLFDLRSQVPFARYKVSGFGGKHVAPRRMFFFGDGAVSGKPASGEPVYPANISPQGLVDPSGTGYVYSNQAYPTLDWSTPVPVLRNPSYLQNSKIFVDYKEPLPIPAGYSSVPVGESLNFFKNHINSTWGLNFDSVLINEYEDGKSYIAEHNDKEALGDGNAVFAISLGGSRDFYFRGIKGTPAEGEKHNLKINHGDLMVMMGTTQANYLHSVPKRAKGELRISVTYRQLIR